MKNKKIIWFKWLSSLLIGIFLISGYLFLNTEKGLEAALLIGKQFLPGQLKINTLHGRLLGPIYLKKLNYKNNKINFYISEAEFDLNWRSFLAGKLTFNSIFIDQLNLFIKQKTNTIQKKSKTDQRKNIHIPEIFHYLKINSAVIHQINIKTENLNLKLYGSIHQQWHIHWLLTINELARFLPHLKNNITLQGTIRGIFQYPEFNIALEKTNLQWNDWKFKQIQSTLTINTKDKRWFFDFTASDFSNKQLKIFPVKLKLTGSFLPFSLQGTLSQFKLNKGCKDQQLTSIIVPQTHMNSFVSRNGLETSIQTFETHKNQFIAYLLLPHYQVGSPLKFKQKINATIDLTLKNLNFLTGLFPEFKRSHGFFNAQLKISGLLQKPAVTFTLHLQQASISIPSLGLHLKNINYQLHTDKHRLQGIGQIYSGKGFITFTSKTDLLKPHLSTLIKIKGENVTLVHNPNYQIIASPQLTINATINQVETEGFILFPKAKIKINPQNYNLIELSSDVQFSDKKKTLTLPFNLKSNLKIKMGNDIHLYYRGLRAQLKGSLSLKQASDHPLFATGQLQLFPGEYSYYGQRLKLAENSTLNFVNMPINNPLIHITAHRNIFILPVSTSNNSNEIKSKLGSNHFIQSEFSYQSRPVPVDIGLHIRGRLQNPQITLFANPSNRIKSSLDMLSYLITGQASNEISAASTQLLLNAATHLGHEKNNLSGLINKFQKKIGLDQLTIGVKPIFDPRTNRLEQNTSIIVGKKLSPRLNVSYSLGLLDPISILEINYLLNKNFSLQVTRSDFANGIDIFYKLEKN